MNDLYKAFRYGAEALAVNNMMYAQIHHAHGISQADWDLLTKKEHWTSDEARSVNSILSAVMDVSLTIANLPAQSLPGQYVAAVIACLVSPANRLVASYKTPDSYDGIAATGISEPFEVREMKREQMVALVMAYSGGFGGEPPVERLPKETGKPLEGKKVKA